MFNGKVAVVTGGAQGIGKVICEEFKKGEPVCALLISSQMNILQDIADEQTLVHLRTRLLPITAI